MATLDSFNTPTIRQHPVLETLSTMGCRPIGPSGVAVLICLWPSRRVPVIIKRPGAARYHGNFTRAPPLRSLFPLCGAGKSTHRSPAPTTGALFPTIGSIAGGRDSPPGCGRVMSHGSVARGGGEPRAGVGRGSEPTVPSSPWAQAAIEKASKAVVRRWKTHTISSPSLSMLGLGHQHADAVHELLSRARVRREDDVLLDEVDPQSPGCFDPLFQEADGVWPSLKRVPSSINRGARREPGETPPDGRWPHDVIDDCPLAACSSTGLRRPGR